VLVGLKFYRWEKNCILMPNESQLEDVIAQNKDHPRFDTTMACLESEGVRVQDASEKPVLFALAVCCVRSLAKRMEGTPGLLWNSHLFGASTSTGDDSDDEG
jgi:hypothetical protein